jgi:hypothetical protein
MLSGRASARKSLIDLRLHFANHSPAPIKRNNWHASCFARSQTNSFPALALFAGKKFGGEICLREINFPWLTIVGLR